MLSHRHAAWGIQDTSDSWNFKPYIYIWFLSKLVFDVLKFSNVTIIQIEIYSNFNELSICARTCLWSGDAMTTALKLLLFLQLCSAMKDDPYMKSFMKRRDKSHYDLFDKILRPENGVSARANLSVEEKTGKINDLCSFSKIHKINAQPQNSRFCCLKTKNPTTFLFT